MTITWSSEMGAGTRDGRDTTAAIGAEVVTPVVSSMVCPAGFWMRRAGPCRHSGDSSIVSATTPSAASVAAAVPSTSASLTTYEMWSSRPWVPGT